MHGDAFADGAVVADHQRRAAALVLGVLRRPAEHRLRIDLAVLADRGRPDASTTWLISSTSVADHRLRRRHGRTARCVTPAPSLAPGSTTASGMDDRFWLHACVRLSGFARGAIIAAISASATLAPSTKASQAKRQILPRFLSFLHVDLEPVARHHRLAELGVVDGHEIDERRLVAAVLP